MELSKVITPTGIDLVRSRRSSVWSAMSGLEKALAMPAIGRIDAWSAEVGHAAQVVGVCIDEHVRATEGPAGFHAEMVAAAPRLAHAVNVAVDDHARLAELSNRILSDVGNVRTAEDVDRVRDLGTELVAAMSRHRQRGADMIYQAYEYDLGGED
jgi:hypothetical protein